MFRLEGAPVVLGIAVGQPALGLRLDDAGMERRDGPKNQERRETGDREGNPAF